MNTFKKYLKDGNVFVNKCDNCGCGMIEGYMKGCGDEYICSDECLFINGYTKKERDEDYEDEYICWTTWEVLGSNPSRRTIAIILQLIRFRYN